MFDWANVALSAVRVVDALLTFLRERQLLDAGAQAAVAALLRKQLDEIAKADTVLADADARARRVPVDQALPDDGFRRD